MKRLQELTVSGGSAYIRYAENGATFARQRDLLPDGAVSVDLDDAGDVIGIEIVYVSHPDHIAVARDFAKENGLAFPRDLSGALEVA